MMVKMGSGSCSFSFELEKSVAELGVSAGVAMSLGCRCDPSKEESMSSSVVVWSWSDVVHELLSEGGLLVNVDTQGDGGHERQANGSSSSRSLRRLILSVSSSEPSDGMTVLLELGPFCEAVEVRRDRGTCGVVERLNREGMNTRRLGGCFIASIFSKARRASARTSSASRGSWGVPRWRWRGVGVLRRSWRCSCGLKSGGGSEIIIFLG